MTWLIVLIVGPVIALIGWVFWKANRKLTHAQRVQRFIAEELAKDRAQQRGKLLQMQQGNPYLRDVFARKD